MRKLMLLMAVMVVSILPSTAAMAQSDEGQVIVVHGVPDLDADVYVNGELTLEGFQFGDVAGPLDLPAGTYEIEIFAALYPKEELPLDAIFSKEGPPVLTLITCGGGFDPGVARYDSNVVVYAMPAVDFPASSIG